MNYIEDKKFDFENEEEVEKFVEELLTEFKFEDQQKKEYANHLMLSIMYYVLALKDKDYMNEVVKIVIFDYNALNNGEEECLYAKFVEQIAKVKSDHPAVQHYGQLKKLSAIDLARVFADLKEILM